MPSKEPEMKWIFFYFQIYLRFPAASCWPTPFASLTMWPRPIRRPWPWPSKTSRLAWTSAITIVLSHCNYLFVAYFRLKLQTITYSYVLKFSLHFLPFRKKRIHIYFNWIWKSNFRLPLMLILLYFYILSNNFSYIFVNKNLLCLSYVKH